MKENKRGLISEVLTQLIVLLFLGAGLVWIIRHSAVLGELGPLSFLRHLVPIACVIYVILLVTSIRSLFSDYFLKRYDPADPESVRELAMIRRYRLGGNTARLKREPAELIKRLEAGLRRDKAREVSRRSFGIVFERPATTPFQSLRGRYERIILLYRPILNVLIADRLLSEAAEYIYSKNKPNVRRNCILLMSDMENDTEMLSSAAGIVNYLSRVDNGKLLYPFLLDLNHDRLFYPQDHSMLSLADRYYFYNQRNTFLEILGVSTNGPLPEIKPEEARPAAGSEASAALPLQNMPKHEKASADKSRPEPAKSKAIPPRPKRAPQKRVEILNDAAFKPAKPAVSAGDTEQQKTESELRPKAAPQPISVKRPPAKPSRTAESAVKAPAAPSVQPVQTSSSEGRSAQVKPAPIARAESKPAQVKPATVLKTDSKPAQVKPAPASKAEAKTAQVKPAPTSKAEAKPAPTRAAELKPAPVKQAPVPGSSGRALPRKPGPAPATVPLRTSPAPGGVREARPAAALNLPKLQKALEPIPEPLGKGTELKPLELHFPEKKTGPASDSSAAKRSQ